MINVKTICDQLQATNGKKDKEKILLENINNELFIETIFFLLNPFLITGISTKKINKQIGVLPNVNYSNLLTSTDFNYLPNDIRSLYRYISKNNTGRDVDLSVCESFYRT